MQRSINDFFGGRPKPQQKPQQPKRKQRTPRQTPRARAASSSKKPNLVLSSQPLLLKPQVINHLEAAGPSDMACWPLPRAEFAHIGRSPPSYNWPALETEISDESQDISEVLAYKPAAPGQRKSRFSDNTDAGEQATQRKRQRREDDSAGTSSASAGRALSKEAVLKALEEESGQASKSGSSLAEDLASIKRLLLQLEKRTTRNAELRVKFSDNPQKFMESEVELHAALQELHVLPTVPQCYPTLCSMRSADHLLQLVCHENTDISIAVIDLLEEMTDTDVLAENPDDTEEFIDKLLTSQVTQILVQNIDRLDEAIKEEGDGVHSTFGIIENLCEARPDCIEEMASKHGLLNCILRRLRKGMFKRNDNKLFACEILAILLQSSDANRQLLGQLNGIDILLSQLAHYKRHDPKDSEERELMENLFNCLCSALLTKINKQKFLTGEGLQLMNLILREKRAARQSAIKVLDYAISGGDGAENAIKFVDVLGLRTLFPAFMRLPKTKKAGLSQQEVEEHLCSVLNSLLRHSSSSQQHRQRVLGKFCENEFAKVERLVELHFKCREQVKSADRQLLSERRQPELWTATNEQELEDEVYLRRLEMGLSTLQLVDLVLLQVCTLAPAEANVAKPVRQLFNIRRSSLSTVYGIVQEYLQHSEDAAEIERLKPLLDKFKLQFLASDASAAN